MILSLLTVVRIMSGSLSCPKCGGYSWIKVIDRVPVQLCICGLRKYLEVHDDGMITTHKPTNVGRVVLPSEGSQLSRILGCLVVLGDMSSAAVAGRLKVSTNNVTTNLCVLRSRGLVRVVENRRGHAGGSLWEVDEAVKLKFLGET